VVQNGLIQRGIQVDRYNVYDTSAREFSDEEVKTARDIDIGTFASPSAVNAWWTSVGKLPRYCVCIGKTSAVKCREYGVDDDRVVFPVNPGVDSWAQSVVNVIQQQFQ